MKVKIEQMNISELSLNTGQIDGLPANPRQWTRDDIKRIAKSLKDTPELFELRPIIAVPHNGENVILGGSLRFCGARENGDEKVPVMLIPESTTTDKMKEIVLKDNGSFGEWDMDALANEWDDLPLTEWGVPAWDTSDVENEQGGADMDDADSSEKASVERIEEVEELLNKAMKDNCAECVKQIDDALSHGWLITGYTVGLAKAYFIRALYYRANYPRWISYIFHPHQFLTSANTRSMYDQMKTSGNEGKAGIAGFRTITEDMKPLTTTTKGSYPVGGARLPMDFPVDRARDLINEFAGRGSKVLDPCHGWGGRFVGALLAGVRSYTGCDPSKEAHDGLEKMKSAYLDYCSDTTKDVNFILSPYEDCMFEEGSFDFALTSPPYFDVEQYHGEMQSHVRYPKYTAWRDGFYTQLISNTYKWLKDGAAFALQVGSQTYPLLEDAKKIAEKVGFIIEDIRPLGGGTSSNLHGNTDDDEDNEKIIILRKTIK